MTLPAEFWGRVNPVSHVDGVVTERFVSRDSLYYLSRAVRTSDGAVRWSVFCGGVGSPLRAIHTTGWADSAAALSHDRCLGLAARLAKQDFVGAKRYARARKWLEGGSRA